ncbi:MAG: glycoside hydrolase family 57 protein [Microscillaceae bacterium]|nr:glycoside hydrolase family 57 protein [Microscillaceae bacterium]
MRTVILYLHVHQPFRLKRYRFFDIGQDHNYYDDFQNENIIKKVAHNCYLPTNAALKEMIQKYPDFKVNFSISRPALDQFETYMPEVIESFQELARTGNVEFIAETNSHSLVSLKSEDEFVSQVTEYSEKINELFGQKPQVFHNTELVYNDTIGDIIAKMGFKAALTEGASHILGWKSPHYVYYNAINPKLKLFLRSFNLSDDIAFRFSDRFWSAWPLTTEKYVSWLNNLSPDEKVVNLFLSYETFGEHHGVETGIFEFLKALPNTLAKNSDFKFSTASEAAAEYKPKAAMHVPDSISWADIEKDLTAWLGNELQNEAFDKLYALKPLIDQIDDPALLRDWRYLQISDHFYYMSTKFFSDGEVHNYFNPYDNPYEAFINYMNVLSDYEIRLTKAPKVQKTKKTVPNGSEQEVVEIVKTKTSRGKKSVTS